LFSFTNISAIPQYNKLITSDNTQTTGGFNLSCLHEEDGILHTTCDIVPDIPYTWNFGSGGSPYNDIVTETIHTNYIRYVNGSLWNFGTSNSSWNETRANSLYYSNTNPSGYYNITTLPSSSFNNTNIAYRNNSQVFAGLNNFSQRVFINPNAVANYNASLIIGTTSPQTAGGIMGKAFTVYASSSGDNGTIPFKAGFVSEYENTQNTGLTYADTTTGAWFRLKNLGTGNQSTMRGVMTQSEYAGTGSIGNVIGGYFASQKTGSGSVTGALIGGSFYVSNAGGTGITNARLLNLEMPYADATNFITNLYAVYINPLNRTGTTNTWGIYQASNIERNYFAGWTGYGTTTKVNTEIVSFVGNTSITGLMKLNTITLPTCSATYKNMIGANATATYGCNSTAWVRLF
jgi:hypothetical protein